MDLVLSSRLDGHRMVVTVAGEIDVATAPQLRQQLDAAFMAGCYDLVVDLTEVPFLDSSGLGVLVGGLKRTRARAGSLVLIATGEAVLRMFRATGLTKVFPIFPTLAEAVSSRPLASGP